MFIELTDAVSGNKFTVNMGLVRLIEATSSGGSHLVFSESQGRVVSESIDAIKALLGVAKP